MKSFKSLSAYWKYVGPIIGSIAFKYKYIANPELYGGFLKISSTLFAIGSRESSPSYSGSYFNKG